MLVSRSLLRGAVGSRGVDPDFAQKDSRRPSQVKTLNAIRPTAIRVREPSRRHERMKNLPRPGIDRFRTSCARDREPLEEVSGRVEIALRRELVKRQSAFTEPRAGALQHRGRAPRDPAEGRCAGTQQIEPPVQGGAQDGGRVLQRLPRFPDPFGRDARAIAPDDERRRAPCSRSWSSTPSMRVPRSPGGWRRRRRFRPRRRSSARRSVAEVNATVTRASVDSTTSMVSSKSAR